MPFTRLLSCFKDLCKIGSNILKKVWEIGWAVTEWNEFRGRNDSLLNVIVCDCCNVVPYTLPYTWRQPIYICSKYPYIYNVSVGHNWSPVWHYQVGFTRFPVCFACVKICVLATIEGLQDAVRTYARTIFQNLLVSFFTARYEEKDKKR